MSEVIYEVNLDIDAGIAAEYRSWLHAHVAQFRFSPIQRVLRAAG